MHDETFARLWREFCAHCLTPRDADVVPAPEGYPSDRHADDREARTVHCETCGTEVLVEGGRPVRYCSDACKVIRNALRSATPSRERAVVAVSAGRRRRTAEHPVVTG